ncbi:MAG: bestrophin family protein [Gammaproteobacteria bacterium]
MIVKKKLHWIRLLFCLRGSSFSETWPRILIATAIAVTITYLELHYDIERYTLTTTPFMIIGVALGIFLGFRNNAAYERFWEGRKLWGSLVNTSRNLARQAYSLIYSAEDSEELEYFRRRFVKRVIAFVHALRHHLRETDPIQDITGFLEASDLQETAQASHRPVRILQHLGQDLAFARKKGWLHDLNLPDVDRQLVELSNILGGCERIKSTPIPFTYTVLIHRLVAFYCLFLPFGLVDTTQFLTPLVVFLVSHAFFGLDAIGDEIEQPFDTDPNDLPLAAISRNIEINLLELINEPCRPEPLVPEKGILT